MDTGRKDSQQHHSKDLNISARTKKSIAINPNIAPSAPMPIKHRAQQMAAEATPSVVACLVLARQSRCTQRCLSLHARHSRRPTATIEMRRERRRGSSPGAPAQAGQDGHV